MCKEAADSSLVPRLCLRGQESAVGTGKCSRPGSERRRKRKARAKMKEERTEEQGGGGGGSLCPPTPAQRRVGEAGKGQSVNAPLSAAERRAIFKIFQPKSAYGLLLILAFERINLNDLKMPHFGDFPGGPVVRTS